MLNPNTVYFKTEAGMAEVGARALGLRAELRRLLILVDGSATLARLAVFVRGSEIDALIAELETQGLVTRGNAPVGTVSTSVPPAPTSNATRAAPADGNLEPTAAQMQAVRQMAISTLHNLLGPGAFPLAVKIEQCRDAQELRVAITEIRQTLDRQLGIATGQRFLDAVRAAAEGTR